MLVLFIASVMSFFHEAKVLFMSEDFLIIWETAWGNQHTQK